MKILIFGFFMFVTWSALSTYIYVCKIKGLCNEPKTLQSYGSSNTDTIVGDTLIKSRVPEKTAIPENLIVYFAFDKSDFNADTTTDKYFYLSTAYLEQNIHARLSITGHTDAIGSDEYNKSLGYRRARTMQHYFESKGLQANKIIVESKGEKEPADLNNTAAGRTNNRRTVITIKK
ncbi:MAG: OmpA family protein [Bacteroidales bacterium]|nr:OmpA family protein [Bacteroidales bacterium]